MMKQTIIALSVAAMMAGCSTATMKPVSEGVAKVEREAEAAKEPMRLGKPVATTPEQNSVRRVNTVWFPAKKVDASTPAMDIAVRRSFGVKRRFTSVSEAAAYVTAQTGIPVVLDPRLNSSSSSASSQPIPASPAVSGASLPPAPSGASASAMTAAAVQQQSVQTQQTIEYDGSVGGFMDLVAARFGVYWEKGSHELKMFKTKPRTFRLAALPGETSMTGKVGTASSGGSNSTATSTASTEQKSAFEFTGMSVWVAVENSVKTMLSPEGRVVVTPATGTITVDDTPEVLDRVRSYVDEQNIAMSRQVVVNVKVLAVDTSDSDEYGINWNAVYENVNRSIGVSLANTFATTTGATALTLKVLSGSMWDGTSAMISALSKQGKVSQVTSASLVTINNQPVPIQVGRQTTYLKSSTTTIGTGGAGNTTTLEPGTITTGFSMNMLPHILDGNKLMLQYSGDISALNSLDKVESNGSAIQTPSVDTRNFLQRVIVNSGEMLVLTGFEQFDLSGNTQGVGNAENVSAGGGVNVSKKKNMLVVLIQPQLMETR